MVHNYICGSEKNQEEKFCRFVMCRKIRTDLFLTDVLGRIWWLIAFLHHSHQGPRFRATLSRLVTEDVFTGFVNICNANGSSRSQQLNVSGSSLPRAEANQRHSNGFESPMSKGQPTALEQAFFFQTRRSIFRVSFYI